MASTVSIDIPFDLDPAQLVLDPSSKDKTADEVMGWITDNVPWESTELIRIMTAAVVLHQAHAGTFGECLDTAVVWERG